MKRFLVSVGLLAALCVLLCGCETVVPADGTTASSESTTTVSTTLSTTTTESATTTTTTASSALVTSTTAGVTTTASTTVAQPTTTKTRASTTTAVTTTVVSTTTHPTTTTTTTESSTTKTSASVIDIRPTTIPASKEDYPDAARQQLSLVWNEETITLTFADFAETLRDNATVWFYKGKTKAGRTVRVKVLNQGDRIVSVLESAEWEPGFLKQDEIEPFFKKQLAQMGFDTESVKIKTTVMASGTQVRTNFASVSFSSDYGAQIRYVDGGPRLTTFAEYNSGNGEPYPAPEVINEYFIANWV